MKCFWAGAIFLILTSPTSASAHLEQWASKEEIRAATKSPDFITKARLRDISPDQKKYDFSVLGRFHASLKQTFEALTQFQDYAKFLPLVQESTYRKTEQELDLKGGVWGYYLASTLKLNPQPLQKVEFEVIRGHFLGMKGFLQLEEAAEGYTLALLQGSQEGKTFPPKFLIENGARFALSLMGRRMRSFIEEQKSESTLEKTPRKTPGKTPGKNDDQLPRPQRHLGF